MSNPKTRRSLRIERLEDRTTPAAFASDAFLVAGAGAGGPPEIRILDPDDGTVLSRYLAFDAGALGGVRTAVGDINNDGNADIVAVGAGSGGRVKVWNGATGTELRNFFPFGQGYTGGLNVATGDVNGDGFDDLVFGAGAGGAARVAAVSGRDGSQLANFFAYEPSFLGGVRVATGDTDGDGDVEIITAAGAGGGPHVQIFEADGTSVASFFAYDPAFNRGVFVGAGDVDGDGRADIVTGAGAGGGSHVRVFSGGTGEEIAGPYGSFFAYEPSFRGGTTVSVANLSGDGRAEVLTAPGVSGGPAVKVFENPDTLGVAQLAFPANYRAGVTVSGGVGAAVFPQNPDATINAAYETLYNNAVTANRTPPQTVNFTGVNFPVLSTSFPTAASTSAAFADSPLTPTGSTIPRLIDAPGLFTPAGSFLGSGFFNAIDPSFFNTTQFADPLTFQPTFVSNVPFNGTSTLTGVSNLGGLTTPSTFPSNVTPSFQNPNTTNPALIPPPPGSIGSTFGNF